MTIIPTFLQEWNEFYCEFVNSSNYHRYVTLQHDNDTIDADDDDAIAQPRRNQQSPPNAKQPNTLSQPCPSPKQSIISIQTAPLDSTPTLPQHAIPGDSHMAVHTTAAASTVDNDVRPWSNSSSAPLEEDPTDVNNTFLQEWNEFYREFVNSSNYHRYVTQHDNATIDADEDDEIAQPRRNQQSPPNAEQPNTLSQPCPSPKQSIISIQTAPLDSNPTLSRHAIPCGSQTVTATSVFEAADSEEPNTQSWNPQQSSTTAAPPPLSTHPSPPAPDLDALLPTPNTPTTQLLQPALSRTSSTPVHTTAITLAAGDIQPHSPSATAPPDDAPIAIISANTTHDTPSADFGFVRLTDSLDRLADQQTRYFAMMRQANAQVTAQLQQLVIIMQPFVALLPIQEGASTPSQPTENLQTTAHAIITQAPKPYHSKIDNLSDYPATSETIPTIAMSLVQFPVTSGVMNKPIPPWPPQSHKCTTIKSQAFHGTTIPPQKCSLPPPPAPAASCST